MGRECGKGVSSLFNSSTLNACMAGWLDGWMVVNYVMQLIREAQASRSIDVQGAGLKGCASAKEGLENRGGRARKQTHIALRCRSVRALLVGRAARLCW